MRVYQGKLPLHFVTTAELAHQVLTGDTDKFDKGLFIDKLRLAFGNGLVSTDGEFHRRPPRMIQPTFHRRPLTRYSETMTALAADPANSWRDGQVLELDRATDCSTSETLRAAEAPYFRSPLRACALSGYGHSMNLAPNARDYCSAVSSWVSQEVGR